MRVHVEEDEALAAECRVLDKATGEVIPLVRWADTDTREVGVIRSDDRGVIVDNPDDPGGFFEDVLTGRGFRIVRWRADDQPYEVLAETA